MQSRSPTDVSMSSARRPSVSPRVPTRGSWTAGAPHQDPLPSRCSSTSGMLRVAGESPLAVRAGSIGPFSPTSEVSDSASGGGQSSVVQVYVRCRPFIDRERQRENVVVDMSQGGACRLTDPQGKGNDHLFQFDGCLWSIPESQVPPEPERPVLPCAGQAEVYSTCAAPLLFWVMEGFNGCLFAYGMTGSGKTYTMTGGPGEAEEGIDPRLCKELFARIAAQPATKTTVQLSYTEIYLEQVSDLLCPGSGELRVREDKFSGHFVEGLSLKEVHSVEEVLRLMQSGNRARHTATTELNKRSSRSHAIVTLHVTQDFPDGRAKQSKLQLVDLAGSERISESGAQGARAKEATNINVSLTALGRVIDSLADQAQDRRTIHVPYRDSQLTKLLCTSLGGNSKTVMIATVSPAAEHFEETQQTLRYASRARYIVNFAVVNEGDGALQARLRELEMQVRELRKQPSAAVKLRDLETENKILYEQIHSLQQQRQRTPQQAEARAEAQTSVREHQTKQIKKLESHIAKLEKDLAKAKDAKEKVKTQEDRIRAAEDAQAHAESAAREAAEALRRERDAAAAKQRETEEKAGKRYKDEIVTLQKKLRAAQDSNTQLTAQLHNARSDEDKARKFADRRQSQTVRAAKQEHERALEEAAEGVQKAEVMASKLRQELADTKERLKRAETARHQALLELDAARGTVREQERAAADGKRRAQDAAARAETAERELKAAKARAAEQGGSLGARCRELEEQNAALILAQQRAAVDADAAAKELHTRLQSAQAQLSEAEGRVEAAEGRLRELEGDSERLAAVEEAKQQLAARVKELQQEGDQQRRRAQTAAQDHNEQLRAATARFQKSCAEWEQQRTDLERRNQEGGAQLRALEEKLRAAEGRIRDIDGKRADLEKQLGIAKQKAQKQVEELQQQLQEQTRHSSWLDDELRAAQGGAQRVEAEHAAALSEAKSAAARAAARAQESDRAHRELAEESARLGLAAEQLRAVLDGNSGRAQAAEAGWQQAADAATQRAEAAGRAQREAKALRAELQAFRSAVEAQQQQHRHNARLGVRTPSSGAAAAGRRRMYTERAAAPAV
eukprot:TRINITY_DN11232_c0_g1_i5.p1 TRINITY_DN11232_c0_g1~~TRINITY_DN11232_c0_g1_i5.p1  ORF type:complete len:1081 (+),score=407.74 TRINITY_DN11232_c0_g1_i5:100-3342(+)